MLAGQYDFAEEFKQTYMSQQRPAPAAMTGLVKMQLQSHPPLGQVTPVGNGALTVVAVLEVAQLQEDGWEVALWCSSDGGEWTQRALAPIDAGAEPENLQLLPASASRLYFTCPLSITDSLKFTLKFRNKTGDNWRWARDETGVDDGLVVVTRSQSSGTLADLIPDLTDWRVSSHHTSSPQTRLWLMQVTIPAAKGEASTCTDTTIGIPWGSYLSISLQFIEYPSILQRKSSTNTPPRTVQNPAVRVRFVQLMSIRWFALVRVWSPWLAPRQGKSHFGLDKDALLCSFLSSQGENLVFLAVSGLGDVSTTFRSTDTGGLTVHARNEQDTEGNAIVLVSLGHDLERAVAAVMHYARDLTADAKVAHSQEPSDPVQTKALSLEWHKTWFDGLGFCTWNALGQMLTEEKILRAVDKLSEHQINITTLIIDNWQSIDANNSPFHRAWLEFEADRSAFPNGLKGLISQIRQRHPKIQHIAVWHALLGYWGHLCPWTVIAKDDVERFYDDFYRFLTESGVDGVKKDAQFIVDTWVAAPVRRELIHKYLDAWSSVSFRYFGVKTISCMSQIPQALFRSQMRQDRPPLVVRNSDDFFPEIPASHPWHVWTNAHNSVLTQFLNVLPDWDMFQTVHDYSGFHAAARCVSGGPIYVTDVPGEHDMGLIGQMTGVTPGGRTVIFRPKTLGRSLHYYAGYDDGLLLKVGARHATPGFNVGILGVFNISARPLTELIPLTCLAESESSTDHVVRAHSTGKVSRPVRDVQLHSLLSWSLDTRGYEILCAFPLTPFSDSKKRRGWVANLGLMGKMTGCAAVMASSIHQDETGVLSLTTRLKALGVLGIYVSGPAASTLGQTLKASIGGQPVASRLVRPSQDGDNVFEVDLGAAWRELEPGGASGAEVEARVWFRA